MPGFDPKRECNGIHTATRKLGIIVIPGRDKYAMREWNLNFLSGVSADRR